jgi:hypothetical protein
MAIERNYTIQRGIPLRRQVTVTLSDNTPVDITGVTFLGQIRESKFPTDIRYLPKGTGELAEEFDFEIIDGTNGIFIFELTINKSLGLQRAVYDFDIVVFLPETNLLVVVGRITVEELVSHIE